ncbi:glycosyltransferase family 4 protein [uncultured Flavobacterium sp.]|uniref:glycosyltransferase family 4 protein n=1 Tax=uncultured Flavobacterium sp. TaxID=165435 RepID=UPI0030EF82B0|tara:strand:- start:6096 stop:7178 length:1083 start_codon:yes stop_codon:yes gene_type:complete
MKQNNIGIFTSEFPPLPGGIGAHAYMLSKYLMLEGYEITILTDFRSEKEDIIFDAQQDFKIVRVKRGKLTYFNRILKGITIIRHNEIIIASGKFSLWLVGFLKLFFPQKKYISVLHGTELRAGNKIAQSFTKWSLKKFNNNIAVSNYTKNVAISLNPTLQIDVINNGIEVITISDIKTVNKQVINLITVGNLTFRKGQQNVIKALPLLKNTFPLIHYHCIGISTEIESFVKLADTLQVKESITFYGPLSNEKKNKILESSTIFVMLSDIVKNDFEGFGIAILEANSFGIPAIGSENSGIADAIKNHYSGILVNPHQPELLQTAIFEIVQNYQDYSSNAISWASEFEWKTIIQKYINVIER